MKTFILNAARGVVSQKKKLDATSKLMGREWRMLTEEPSITGKYIFLKDGKLLLSVNGLSTYSSWQMATDSTIIMEEGVATFLYKVVYIDENLVVLNLDGTDSFCFLINDSSQSFSDATLEDIQWYLYRHYNIDLLSAEMKSIVEMQRIEREEKEREELESRKEEDEKEEALAQKFFFALAVIAIIILILVGILSNK